MGPDVPEDVAAIIRRARTIAVVGCSDNPGKAAHRIPARVFRAGFRVLPVNPNTSSTEMFGTTVVGHLRELSEQVDIVDVFRPSSDAAEVARAAAAMDPRPGCIWLQSGIRSLVARRIAEAADIAFVEDRCLGVDVADLGIHRD